MPLQRYSTRSLDFRSLMAVAGAAIDRWFILRKIHFILFCLQYMKGHKQKVLSSFLFCAFVRRQHFACGVTCTNNSMQKGICFFFRCLYKQHQFRLFYSIATVII